MYGLFTYIGMVSGVNDVGIYSIHGWSGLVQIRGQPNAIPWQRLLRVSTLSHGHNIFQSRIGDRNQPRLPQDGDAGILISTQSHEEAQLVSTSSSPFPMKTRPPPPKPFLHGL